MKKIVNYLTTGLGIGAFAYLLVLIKVETTTSKAILSLLAMSALIGLSAMIYERESLSLAKRWLLHLLVVLILLSATLAFNSWLNLPALVWTTSLYTLIFWGIYHMKGEAHA